MTRTKLFTLEEIFVLVKKGDIHASNKLVNGDIPLIGCGFLNQGVEGYFDLFPENIHTHSITITGDGSYPLTAFYHPYNFGAKDNVIICQPKKEESIPVIFYILSVINNERWRFSYGRKCYITKMKKLKFALPINGENELDKNYMSQIVIGSSPYWKYMKKLT
jgi:hypothetical protein